MTHARWTALVVLAVAPAAAQPLPSASVDTPALVAEKAESVVGAAGPTDRAGSGLSGSAIQLSSEEGEAEASVSMNLRLVRYSPRPTAEAGIYRLSSLSLVFTGAMPIDDKGGGFSRLFSGDSLVTGTRLKSSLVYTRMTQKDGTAAAPDLIALSRACAAEVLQVWAAGDVGKQDRATRYLAILEMQSRDSIALYGQAVRLTIPANAAVADAAKEANDRCWDNKQLADFEGYGSNGLYERAVRHAYVDSPMLYAGLDASVGKDSYKSLDRANFNIDEVKRTSWEAGAYLGLIGPTLNWSVRGRVVHGKKYDAAADGQTCRAVVGVPQPECISGPDGAPIRTMTTLASVEGRYRTKLIGGQEIAFAPQVTYDFEDDVLGVEVPIYLSPDKDGRLSGGLKLAYSSDMDDFGVGVFVGVPFSIFFD